MYVYVYMYIYMYMYMYTLFIHTHTHTYTYTYTYDGFPIIVRTPCGLFYVPLRSGGQSSRSLPPRIGLNKTQKGLDGG